MEDRAVNEEKENTNEIRKVGARELFLKRLLFYAAAFSLLFTPSFFSYAQQQEFAKELSGEDLYVQGMNLFLESKYQESLLFFEEAAKRKANFAEAYLQIGIVYGHLKDFVQARQNLISAKILSFTSEDIRRAEEEIQRMEEVEKKEKERRELLQKEQEQKVQQERNEKEKQDRLFSYGISGEMVKEGFLVKDVGAASIAERAGILPGQIISRIADTPVKYLATVVDGLSLFQSSNRILLLSLFTGEEVRTIGWPPVMAETLSSETLKQIEFFQATGTSDLQRQSFKSSIEMFQSVLLRSIHYPWRIDTFLGLAKAYGFMAATAWQDPVPSFPLRVSMTSAELKSAKKTLSDAETTFALGKEYYESALSFLRDAGVERKRAGALSRFEKSEEETSSIVEYLQQIQELYVAERVAEIEKFRNTLRQEDFTSWITVRARAWWKEELRMRRELFYSPQIDLTFRNLATDIDFEGDGEIFFIDPLDRIGSSVPFHVVCSRNSSALVHVEGTTRFRQNDVWEMAVIGSRNVAVKKKTWKARVFLENRLIGDFSIP